MKPQHLQFTAEARELFCFCFSFIGQTFDGISTDAFLLITDGSGKLTTTFVVGTVILNSLLQVFRYQKISDLGYFFIFCENLVKRQQYSLTIYSISHCTVVMKRKAYVS